MTYSAARTCLRLLTAAFVIGALTLPAEARKSPKKKGGKPAAHKVTAAPAGPPVPARAVRPLIVVDYRTGDVIEAVNPFTPWHPASLTKMMTTYVALQAIKSGRASKDTLLGVTPFAAKQPPSKMAFAPGTRLTLEAALFILFVKSANDVAVTVAEGISGSVPAFADEMNEWSRRLGMTGSQWRNPNGWHDDAQFTTARDMALLARALYRDFPEYQHLYRTQALQYGEWTMRNYNVLIGRFPGADGLKTGFTCPSGFNLVASATRGGQRHIAVVLGENSGRGRAEKAAALLERSFTVAPAGEDQQRTQLDRLAQPAGVRTAPPNMRHEVCGKGAPSEADETGSAQVLSLVPATPGAAVVPNGLGDQQPLVASPPTQVTAVVLARSVVDKKDKRPLVVAVAGTATVGPGLALPAEALQAADLRSPTPTTAVFARTQPAAPADGTKPAINGDEAPQAASLVPRPLSPPSAPVTLVPAAPAKPGAIAGGTRSQAATANPAAKASLVAGGKAQAKNRDAAPGAVGSGGTRAKPGQESQSAAPPAPAQ